MKPNKLINEKSPYLLQHAYNPVNWYPWNEKAFEKAKEEDKLIFLSIGYFSCHWCHVMEEESFKDKEISQILNENYISIKVDKEERPDIDNVYMNVCMLMTGKVGWPLTIIMTPDKKPIFAGHYLSKDDQYGKIGLKNILLKISDLWQKNKEGLINRAEQIINHIQEDINLKEEVEINPKKLIQKTFLELKNDFDRNYGGFGDKPKFPSPHKLLFLLRYWKRTREKEALEIVKFTLNKMRFSGIYDHVGFGFHRYSTDKKWFLPHFEKMLYDQALLIVAYVETYQETKDSFFKKVAEEIAEYLLRDMYSFKEAFFSSEDADSEGEEGKFYTWDYEELKEILNENFEIFKKIYPVKKEGNFRDETTKELTYKNILYMEKTLEELSKEIKIPKEKLEEKVENFRKKLFEVRKKIVLKKIQKFLQIGMDWLL